MEPRALLGVAAGFLLSAGLTACSEAGASDGDHHDYGAPEPLGSQTSRQVASDPVSTVVDSGCSTAPLLPLSTQLVEEIDCLSPGALISFSERLGDGIAAGSSVFPFLQSFAVDSLEKVIDARGTTLQLNSGLRTLPQQFVLYRWYQLGRCGITLAAQPGNSNHESGLAVDVQDNAGWRPFFLAEGWQWQGETDPVHFDIQGGVDLSGLSILAFQRMWNRNHPEDLIEEDGLYGDITEARLTSSPIGGFAIGAVCDAEPDPGQGGAPAAGAGGNSASAGTGGDSSMAGSSGSAPMSSSGAAGSPATGAGTAGSPPGAGSTSSPLDDGASDSGACSCRAAGAGHSSFGAWLVLASLVLLRRRVPSRAGARQRLAMGSVVAFAGFVVGCSSSADEDTALMDAAGTAGMVAGMAGSPSVAGAASYPPSWTNRRSATARLGLLARRRSERAGLRMVRLRHRHVGHAFAGQRPRHLDPRRDSPFDSPRRPPHSGRLDRHGSRVAVIPTR